MAIESIHTYKALPYKIDGENILVDTSYQRELDSYYKQDIDENKKGINGNLFDKGFRGQTPSKFRDYYLNYSPILNGKNFAVAGMTTKGGSQPDYKITEPGTYELYYSSGFLRIVNTNDYAITLYRCSYSSLIKSIKIWVCLVGGGGGGGWGNAYTDASGLSDGGGGGGGGGGGVVIHPLIINDGEMYQVEVGSGGAGAKNEATDAKNGGATILYNSSGAMISYGNGGREGGTTRNQFAGIGGKGGDYMYKYSSTYNYIGATGSNGGDGGSKTTKMDGYMGGEANLSGSDFTIDYNAVGYCYRVGGEGTPAIYDGLRSYVGGGGGGVAGFYGSIGSSDIVNNKVVTRTEAEFGGGGHGAGGNSDVSRVGSKGGDGLFAIWCL